MQETRKSRPWAVGAPGRPRSRAIRTQICRMAAPRAQPSCPRIDASMHRPPRRAARALSRLAPQGHRGCAPAPAAGRHVNPRADRAGLPRGPRRVRAARRPASAVGLWPAPSPACRTVARRCRCLSAAEARQRRRPPTAHHGGLLHAQAHPRQRPLWIAWRRRMGIGHVLPPEQRDGLRWRAQATFMAGVGESQRRWQPTEAPSKANCLDKQHRADDERWQCAACSSAAAIAALGLCRPWDRDDVPNGRVRATRENR